MDFEPNCFVSGSFAKVLRLARFAGVAPLSFIKAKEGWRVTVSPTLSVFGYRCITIIIFLTVGALFGELFVDQKRSVRMRTDTRRVAWLMDSLIMTMLASISVFRAPRQMRSMIGCINHLQKINSVLNVHQWPASPREDRRSFLIAFWAVVSTITLCCVDHGISLYLAYYSDAAEWISQMYLLYYFYYWIMQMQEILFVMITQHVVYSFKAANNCLRQVLHDVTHAGVKLYIKKPSIPGVCEGKKHFKNKVKSKEVSKKTVSGGNTMPDFTKPHTYRETIHTVAQMYQSTCDVVREVDRCHGLLVVMMLLSFLLHLVVTLYYLITSLFEQNSNKPLMSFVEAIVQIVWCIYHAANLVIVIEPSHASHAEMDTTRELVSHLMHCTYSIYDPLAVELERFSRHLMLNQVSYCPMKITTLTRSLVVTILGSITTYLVLLVQI